MNSFSKLNNFSSIDEKILRIVEKRYNNPKPNQIYHAACPSCKNIQTLEICFECHQPLCSMCIKNHFGVWKEDLNKKMNIYENELTECLSNIGKYFYFNYFK